MPIVSEAERQTLRLRYQHDAELLRALLSLEQAETLLRRSLYEFGVELRLDIESFLQEPPLLPSPHP